AVHAPGRLLLDELVVGSLVDLPPVGDPHRHGAVRRDSSLVLQEATRIAHGRSLESTSMSPGTPSAQVRTCFRPVAVGEHAGPGPPTIRNRVLSRPVATRRSRPSSS